MLTFESRRLVSIYPGTSKLTSTSYTSCMLETNMQLVRFYPDDGWMISIHHLDIIHLSFRWYLSSTYRPDDIQMISIIHISLRWYLSFTHHLVELGNKQKSFILAFEANINLPACYQRVTSVLPACYQRVTSVFGGRNDLRWRWA